MCQALRAIRPDLVAASIGIHNDFTSYMHTHIFFLHNSRLSLHVIRASCDIRANDAITDILRALLQLKLHRCVCSAASVVLHKINLGPRGNNNVLVVNVVDRPSKRSIRVVVVVKWRD